MNPVSKEVSLSTLMKLRNKMAGAAMQFQLPGDRCSGSHQLVNNCQSVCDGDLEQRERQVIYSNSQGCGTDFFFC
jgi:hypothetical protein